MASPSTGGTIERVKRAVSIEEFAQVHLTPAALINNEQSYVCPGCGNGSGPSHTGMTVNPATGRYHCFKCGSEWDIFDLAGATLGIDDVREQIKAVAAWANLPFEAESPLHLIGEKARVNARDTAQDRRKLDEGRTAEAARLDGWRAALTDDCPGMAYLEARGFTPELARSYGLGWDGERERVVLPWQPTGGYYHIDRSIDGGASRKYDKPRAEAVGPQPVHNAEAFGPENPVVFVVEGMFDALAVMASGYQAVCLGGTAYREALTEAAERGYRGTVSVLLDFDETGDKAARDGLSMAEELGVTALRAEPLPGGCKDCGELFAKDKGELAAYLTSEAERAREKAGERYRSALKELRVVDPADALADVFTMRDVAAPLSTGLGGLDRALGGGLRPGLCVLGAVSSLGKTTLMLQVADALAASGAPVLFATIEQGTRELVRKSVSRIMRELNGEGGLNATAQEIGDRNARAKWGKAMNEAFEAACSRYAAQVLPNTQFIEGDGPVSAASIRAVAEKMAEHHGTAPVVFIDYLQLLAPVSDRDTDKQTADKNVTALRQLARDLRTPVLAVSSLNRSSYSGAITLDAFKESGGIEYGADVALGLQPRGIADEAQRDKGASTANAERAMDECKRSSDRECEIAVLKNRNGALPPAPVPLVMHAACGLFEDCPWPTDRRPKKVL